MRTDAQRERARQYYAENRERVLELDRARRQRNPERAPEIRRACYFRNHEKRLAYHRGRFARGQSWAQRNPERTRERDRAYQKVYYLDHRAEQAVRNAAWIQSNPDRVAHNSATR